MKEITFDIDIETEVLKLQQDRLKVYNEIQNLEKAIAAKKRYGLGSPSQHTKAYVVDEVKILERKLNGAVERFYGITERYEGLK